MSMNHVSEAVPIPNAVLPHIARLRHGTPDWRYAAPARDVQRMMVQTWRRGM